MGNNTVQSLTTASGLAELASQLREAKGYYHDPESLGDVKETVSRILAAHPELSGMRLKLDPRISGGYLPGSDTIMLGVVNPSVIAHELAHAGNLRAAPLYSKILRVVNRAAELNNVAALPAMLALRVFVDNHARRSEIFNILSGASSVLAAPGLTEELGASIEAVKDAPNKAQALKTLIPAFLQHTVHALAPTGIYQVGKLL